MLVPLDVEHAANYQRTTLIAPRKGTGLPSGHGLKLVRLLGIAGQAPEPGPHRALVGEHELLEGARVAAACRGDEALFVVAQEVASVAARASASASACSCERPRSQNSR